jgi:purine-binding chemotaxis protein CheW
MADTFILFDLAETTYAVRSRDVRHIEMVETITPVPNAGPWVDGVVVSRGQVVPVLNLRARFGFPRVAHDLRTRLIVVGAEGRSVGLLVDRAREFVSIPSDGVQPPPEAIVALGGRYVEGTATIGGRLVLILRIAEILSVAQDAVPA